MKIHKLTLLTFVITSIYTSIAFSQYVSIPDSVYAPGELIVWFRPGILNEDYLGCDEELSRISDFPLTDSFIKDPNILSVLQQLRITDTYKLVPNLNPCNDTISIARRGDTIYVPDFWNILLFHFDPEDLDMDIPNLAAYLSIVHQDAIKIAEPNFYIDFLDCKNETDSLQKTSWIPFDPVPGTIQISSLGDWDPSISIYGTEVYKAWDRTKGDADIIIGVIDDGVSGSGPGVTSGHPDFGSSGDVVIGGYNYFLTNPQPYYYNAPHGTRVASIMCALSNNGECIPGIVGGSGNSDNAKLVALKVGNSVSVSTFGHSIPAIVEGATSNGAPRAGAWSCDFLNMSFDVQDDMESEIFRAAVAYAYANDVVCGAAMGNDGSEHDVLRPTYPPDIDDNWVLAIGGSYNNHKYHASEYGGYIDILAPFINVALYTEFSSTGAPIAHYCGMPPSNSTFAGTSSSTPHALGICALLKSYWKELLAAGFLLPPYLAPEDYEKLLGEGVSIYDQSAPPQQYYPRPKSNDLGYGLINADKSLSFLTTPYTLEHLEVPMTDFSLPTPLTGQAAISFPGNRQGISSDTIYDYRQYHIVLNNIPYGNTHTYNGIIRVWGRGTRTTGYPDIRVQYDQNSSLIPLPLYRNATWCNITRFDERTFDAETYLYEVYNPTSGIWEWLDGNSPSNLQFAITILADGSQTGIKSIELTNFEISDAYPNPVITQNTPDVNFDVLTCSTNDIDIRITDVYGRCIYDKQIANNSRTISIPISNFPNGMYYVTFNHNGGTTSMKSFMVIR